MKASEDWLDKAERCACLPTTPSTCAATVDSHAPSSAVGEERTIETRNKAVMNRRSLEWHHLSILVQFGVRQRGFAESPNLFSRAQALQAELKLGHPRAHGGLSRPNWLRTHGVFVLQARLTLGTQLSKAEEVLFMIFLLPIKSKIALV